MNRSRLPIVLLLLTVLLITVGVALARPGQLPAGVAARIDGQELTREQYEVELRLKALKSELAGRRDVVVDQPALLNRIIGDMLVLATARQAGYAVEEARLAGEVGAILGRLRLTAADMEAALHEYDLTWEDYQRSVHDYLLLTRYIDEVILQDAPSTASKSSFDDWLAGRYAAAEMVFDAQFLDEINRDAAGEEMLRFGG